MHLVLAFWPSISKRKRIRQKEKLRGAKICSLLSCLLVLHLSYAWVIEELSALAIAVGNHWFMVTTFWSCVYNTWARLLVRNGYLFEAQRTQYA